MSATDEYDTIIVGAGTAGATVARELSFRGHSTLLLERGGTAPRKESLLTLGRVMEEVDVGPQLTTSRGIAAGGSSNLYFGVAPEPPLYKFRKLGIDLGPELRAVKRELVIGPLPDRLISGKSFRVRDSAVDLGYEWSKQDMLIDPQLCGEGYTNRAIWKASQFVDEATRLEGQLITGARANRILFDAGRAVGVEYRATRAPWGSRFRQVRAKRIVVSAGELETPKLLQDSGVADIGRRGFFCNPGYALYGVVPRLRSYNSFIGTMGSQPQDGVELGDANLHRLLHRLMMGAAGKLRHLLNYQGTVGVGVKVHDELGGEFTDDGRLVKTPTHDDFRRLARGEGEARNILSKAGAKHIFNVGLVCAGRVGGLLRIGEHLDHNLQTQYRGLYVCDGSVIPDDVRDPPGLTLICLARYLAKHLG